MEELQRSQEVSPQLNFLILLGNRYGWQPLPEEMSEAEFQALTAATETLAEKDRERARKARKALSDWYPRDDNNLPPIHFFQSRLFEFNDGKNYRRDADGKDTRDWIDVQDLLWKVINRAFPPECLRDRFGPPFQEYRHAATQDPGTPLPSIVRFHASATEREIWQGTFADPTTRDHVVAYVREIENAEEFLGEADVFWDPDQRPLRELKGELGKTLDDKALPPQTARLHRIIDERGHSIVDVTTGHLEEMCAQVHAALEPVIRRQMDEYWGPEDSQAARVMREREIENDEHLRFGRERGPDASFVGRVKELNRIAEYLINGSREPLSVHGESGCGKTALLAKASQNANSHGSPVVRFLGVTPQSSDLRSLLTSLCKELRQRNPQPGSLNRRRGCSFAKRAPCRNAESAPTTSISPRTDRRTQSASLSMK